jgi:hypothetical protein
MSFAISRFVPVLVVERRNGSFGREVPAHNTTRAFSIRPTRAVQSRDDPAGIT